MSLSVFISSIYPTPHRHILTTLPNPLPLPLSAFLFTHTIKLFLRIKTHSSRLLLSMLPFPPPPASLVPVSVSTFRPVFSSSLWCYLPFFSSFGSSPPTILVLALSYFKVTASVLSRLPYFLFHFLRLTLTLFSYSLALFLYSSPSSTSFISPSSFTSPYSFLPFKTRPSSFRFSPPVSPPPPASLGWQCRVRLHKTWLILIHNLFFFLLFVPPQS